MTFAPTFQRPFPATFDRRAAAAPVANWWEAGGAPTPVAAYQPKGAASLAASYVNLANPGTYNAAPGTAPTFDAATGWTFNGSTQYLTTGVVASGSSYCAMIRFSGATATRTNYLFGTQQASAIFNILQLSSKIYYEHSRASAATTAAISGGVLAIAPLTGYKNGSYDQAIPAGGSLPASLDVWIGGLHYDGSLSFPFLGNILAVAIWNTSSNHATWMPAVMAAAAAL